MAFTDSDLTLVKRTPEMLAVLISWFDEADLEETETLSEVKVALRTAQAGTLRLRAEMEAADCLTDER